MVIALRLYDLGHGVIIIYVGLVSTLNNFLLNDITGLILGLRPANERRRYFVLCIHLLGGSLEYIIQWLYIYIYEFCFLWLTDCVLLSDDNSLIPGCLWLLAFVLNNTLILGICCSTIPHLPGCFCPWTFFQNIGLNMVPPDPIMSHLATQLGYSAGEFQALQLVVFATFGVVD